jgi:hypothetical protein
VAAAELSEYDIAGGEKASDRIYFEICIKSPKYSRLYILGSKPKILSQKRNKLKRSIFGHFWAAPK